MPIHPVHLYIVHGQADEFVIVPGHGPEDARERARPILGADRALRVQASSPSHPIIAHRWRRQSDHYRCTALHARDGFRLESEANPEDVRHVADPFVDYHRVLSPASALLFRQEHIYRVRFVQNDNIYFVVPATDADSAKRKAKALLGPDWGNSPTFRAMREESHATVGHIWRGMEGNYLCTSYDSRMGFWMENVANPQDRRNVSERAPTRTFHRIWDDFEFPDESETPTPPRQPDMATTPRPSPTQQEAINRMAAGDGRIERWTGGFWTTPGSAHRDGGPGIGLVPVPWRCNLQTVRAMEARGWVERMHVHKEEWKDERRLTDAGRALTTDAQVRS